MPQHRQRDAANILERDDAPALEEGERLRAEEQRLPGARARTPTHPRPNELRRGVVASPAGRVARTSRVA